MYVSIIYICRLNRALEEANKVKGELVAAERDKKEAKVQSREIDRYIDICGPVYIEKSVHFATKRHNLTFGQV